MGPKKVKKTKQQIEEEKALAEQQRKLEEELERKRQEEEAEKRRIEEEKRRVEEEKRRQEELVRLNAQAPQVSERDASMIEKRAAAKRGRKRDLDDKYILCDPLPDPEDEKDLTTFITLWKEAKDKSLPDAVDNCQTAENVVKAIQLILAESLAQYDYAKIEWCNHYIEQLRNIMQMKYDVVSAEILTYIEKYTKYTDKEIEELKNDNQGGGNRNKDFSAKPEFTERKMSKDISLGLWANVQGKTVQFKKIQFDNFQTGLPRAQASMMIILRCMWTSFDYVSGAQNQKLSDELVVGGVYLCKMYSYPEPPRNSTKWSMRKVLSTEDALKCINYPDTSSTSQADPVGVVVTLPNYIFTTSKDEIKVGVWDEEQNNWSADYIEDLAFDREKRELEFSTRKYAPISFLQSKVTDFPYDSWYLRCTGKECALLSIVTKRINVNIEIHPLCIKLVEMDQPELAHLVDKEFHAGILLFELSKCGIHMLPEDEDAKRGGIHLKDKGAEERAILDIAQTLKCFAFQSVKQSQMAPEDNIVCRLRENPDNDRVFLEDDESDWKTVMWWNNKVSYIKSKNSHDNFVGDIEDGQVTHSILSLAVEGVQSEKCVEECSYSHDIDFIDNVQRTLRLLRLLAFTTAAYDKRSLEEQQQ